MGPLYTKVTVGDMGTMIQILSNDKNVVTARSEIDRRCDAKAIELGHLSWMDWEEMFDGVDEDPDGWYDRQWDLKGETSKAVADEVAALETVEIPPEIMAEIADYQKHEIVGNERWVRID